MSETRFVVLDLTRPEAIILLRALRSASAFRMEVVQADSKQQVGINKRTLTRAIRKATNELLSSWPDANGDK